MSVSIVQSQTKAIINALTLQSHFLQSSTSTIRIRLTFGGQICLWVAWASAGMGKRGHLPPHPHWKCYKVFLCISTLIFYSKTLSRGILCIIFTTSPQTPTDAPSLDTAGDFRPKVSLLKYSSRPLIRPPLEKNSAGAHGSCSSFSGTSAHLAYI